VWSAWDFKPIRKSRKWRIQTSIIYLIQILDYPNTIFLSNYVNFIKNQLEIDKIFFLCLRAFFLVLNSLRPNSLMQVMFGRTWVIYRDLICISTIITQEGSLGFTWAHRLCIAGRLNKKEKRKYEKLQHCIHKPIYAGSTPRLLHRTQVTPFVGATPLNHLSWPLYVSIQYMYSRSHLYLNCHLIAGNCEHMVILVTWDNMRAKMQSDYGFIVNDVGLFTAASNPWFLKKIKLHMH